MLNFGNKEFRNLQEQVLKNAQDIDGLKSRPLLEIRIVDALPESGEGGVLYLVPIADDNDDSDDNGYEEYVWVNGAWELVGSAQIDLSNYVTLDGTQTITGAKTLSGGLTINTYFTSGSHLPESSNNYDVGNSSHIWNNVWTNNVKFSDTSYINVDSNNLVLTGQAGVKSAKDFSPTSGNTLSLGSGSASWKGIYGNTYYIGGAATLKYSNPQIVASKGIRPSENNTLVLGDQSYFWNNIYTKGINMGGSVGGNITYSSGFVFDSAIKPSSSVLNFGAANKRWNKVYASSIAYDDNKVVNVQDLASFMGKPQINDAQIDGTAEAEIYLNTSNNSNIIPQAIKIYGDISYQYEDDQGVTQEVNNESFEMVGYQIPCEVQSGVYKYSVVPGESTVISVPNDNNGDGISFSVEADEYGTDLPLSLSHFWGYVDATTIDNNNFALLDIQYSTISIVPMTVLTTDY